MDGLLALYIFMLAAFTGYEIIAKVPVILHTPLMSGSNFIHGIVLIGAGDVEAVVAAAERKMATEGDMVRAIRAGEDPQAAYLRYRVF